MALFRGVPHERPEYRGDDEAAVLDRSLCDACGKCAEVCYPGALKIVGTPVTVGELVSQVQKDIPFFQSSGGGVTLSGGEPARQASFSYHFLMACQEAGIHTALETTGYARWDVMSALASVTDLFLFDVKFVDSELPPALHRCPQQSDPGEPAASWSS